MKMKKLRGIKMNPVYSRKFVGDDCWVYINQTESGFDVYETQYSGDDDFLESFNTLGEAVKYADNLS